MSCSQLKLAKIQPQPAFLLRWLNFKHFELDLQKLPGLCQMTGGTGEKNKEDDNHDRYTEYT